MRNLMQYYYQLEPGDIHQTNGYFLFSVDGENYQLCTVEEEKDMKLFLQELYQKGIPMHQIVFTVQGNLYIKDQGKIYVLLKLYGKVEEKITLQEIKTLQNRVMYIPFEHATNTSNWGELWSQKIDYFEYQIGEVGLKYREVLDSFTYYVGLAEVGISLFHVYYDQMQPTVLSHKRITFKTNVLQFYNPFFYVVDTKARDSAEYFKSAYVKNSSTFEEIKTFLRESNYTEYEKRMFFIRLFYPSFYFDIFEKVIQKEEKMEALEEVVEKTKKYVDFLGDVYQYLQAEIPMPDIGWLKKM